MQLEYAFVGQGWLVSQYRLYSHPPPQVLSHVASQVPLHDASHVGQPGHVQLV